MTYQNICASYYLGFAKLSIWYARKRILEGSSDFENAFNERVNIFRNTSLSQNGLHPTKDVIPEWDALLKKSRANIRRVHPERRHLRFGTEEPGHLLARP